MMIPRKLLIAILLAWTLLLSIAIAALAMVDQQTGEQTLDSVGSSSAFSFGTLPASGSAVFVTIFGFNSLGYNATVTDNQGNSYSVVSSDPGFSNRTRALIAYAANVTSSGTFTVTINHTQGSGNYLIARATSFTGLATSSLLDQTGTNVDEFGPTPATVQTTGATTVANELVIAVASITDAADAAISTPSRYTEIMLENDFGLHATGEAAYMIVSSTGTQSASWTHGGGYAWTAVIATFKEPTGAPAARRRAAPMIFQ
jgi:hypothetical protein